MKKLLLLLIASIAFSAEPNPFADGDISGTSDGNDIFDDEPKSAEITNKMIFLDAVQKRFWDTNRKNTANTTNIAYIAGQTHSIRTRANMITTFVFDDDKIAFIALGDKVGFEVKEIGKDKYDLSNILTIKPNLVGIDTNLIVIGESGNIYQFHIFSTDHNNSRDPAFVVFVSENREIGKISVENIEEREKQENLKLLEKANKDSTGEVIESETDREIIIGDEINKISIAKSEIERGYTQNPKTNFLGETSKDSTKLMAKDIFNDTKWTYFKFDRNLATSKFPAVFRVVDGYDNPMNSRIVGNYLIVETISDKWTLRIGDEWVCVRKGEK